MRLTVVVGARPNVVKVAPLLPVLERAGFAADVAFTGSRSADSDVGSASPVNFYGVELDSPRWFLDIGLGTEAVQTGRAMIAFEQLFEVERPDAVLVVGDVASTVAASISAVKAGLPVVHLGAGLRCGDLRVPEEVNRVLVSRIAAMHLAPTERALENLEDEGIEPERIHFVGNIGAESVFRHMDEIENRRTSEEFGLRAKGYVLAAFHRPENLSDSHRTQAVLGGIARSPLPVLIPDMNAIASSVRFFGYELPAGARIVESVPYLTMLALIRDAACVLTDSSGVQEEACIVGTPCVTVRDCTEQAATVEAGSNVLVEAEPEAIRAAVVAARTGDRVWAIPKRWDRAVSERVVRALKRWVSPLV